ncbi:MAG: DUF5130 family protein [Sporichthyaceae bacterium]
MLAGDAFSERQREEIIRAIQLGQRISGVPFSVYVGAAEGPARAYARRRHAELGAAAPDSVLIFVDPSARALEIVTGSRARRWVDDRAAGLAAASMTSAFAAGDLAGGIAAGINVLAEHARHPQSLHTQ